MEVALYLVADVYKGYVMANNFRNNFWHFFLDTKDFVAKIIHETLKKFMKEVIDSEADGIAAKIVKTKLDSEHSSGFSKLKFWTN